MEMQRVKGLILSTRRNVATAAFALVLGALGPACQSRAVGIVYEGNDAGVDASTGGSGSFGGDEGGSSGSGGTSGSGGGGRAGEGGGGASGAGGDEDAGSDSGDMDAGEDADVDADGDVPDGDVPPTDHCKPASDWPEELALQEVALHEAINDRRSRGAVCDGTTYTPAPPLYMVPILRCSARLHTKDMVDRNYFSLFNPEGEDPQDRMRRAGWEDPRWGENIYHDEDSAAAVVALWIAAGGDQCTNVVSERSQALGVGRFGNKWTIDLGALDAGTDADLAASAGETSAEAPPGETALR